MQLEEAKKINWSLSALGKVIDALAEQRPHVPYRDSRLTRVLQEALGGNCRTTLLVALSPLSQHADETLSSLRFATRAKAVRNHAKVNYMYSSDQLLVLVTKLQRELACATKQIASGCKLPVPCAPPSPQREKHKDEKRRRRSSESSGVNWARSAEGKMRLRVPLDKLTAAHGDVDETLPRSPSGATSCGSARSVDSLDTTPETFQSEELGPDRDDEAWRPLALAARDAMRSLEAALLAQEGALFEAGLLRADPGSSTASRDAEQGAPESGAGGPPSENAPRRKSSNASASSLEPVHEGLQQPLDNTALSERWRALRHAVDARSLHWRLQVERHKNETLSLELDMRKRHTEELEKELERRGSRVSVMLQDGTFDNKVDAWNDSLRQLLPSLGKRPSWGTSSSSGAGGESRMSSTRRSAAGIGGQEQGSMQNSARLSGRRIARPVPRSGSARGGSNELVGVLRGFSEGPPPLPSSNDSSRGKLTPTRARPLRPEGDAEAGAGAPSPSRAGYLKRAEKWHDHSEGALPDENVWVQTSCKGLLPHPEDMRPVAGTGEAESSPASGVVPPRGGHASGEFNAMCQQFETLQLSHGEMELQLGDVQGELEDRNRQLAALAAELGARDVRVSALRHEVRMRDALLGRLQQDSLKRAEHKDHEVESLVEQAMLQLTTILSSRQAANASAVGERSLLAH